MSDVAIPDGWQQVRLGDACSIFSGFAFKSASWTTNGTPVIKITNVKRGLLNLESCGYVKPESYPKDTKFWIKPDDVLITLTGDVGDLAFIGEDHVKCLINQRVGCLRTNQENVSQYLFYLLSTGELRDTILSLATGSVQSNVSPKSIESIPILLPPLHEQKAIAHILGSLDDKIDQLRKTNTVLEDMASALFKSWFVDFDPVKAKQENRPTGLPKDLDDLFPDSFEDSALGPIPKGWRVGSLSDVTGSVIGGDWGKSSPSETDKTRCYCIRGADIPDLQLGLLPNLPLRYLKQSSITKRILEHGDIALEISGGSPTQSTGRPVLIVDQLRAVYDAPLVTSNFCRIIKFKSPRYSFYVYQWLRFLYVTDVLYQFETGTTGIKNFGYTIFSTIQPLLIPNEAAIFAFEEYLSRKFARTVSVANQIRTLTNLRDTLLPKLISGELRVPDAEQMVAELGL